MTDAPGNQPETTSAASAAAIAAAAANGSTTIPIEPPAEATTARLQALEAEVASLRAELANLRAASPQLPPTPGMPPVGEHPAPPRIFAAAPDGLDKRFADAASRAEQVAADLDRQQVPVWRWVFAGGATTLAVVCLLLILAVLFGPVRVSISPSASTLTKPSAVRPIGSDDDEKAVLVSPQQPLPRQGGSSTPLTQLAAQSSAAASLDKPRGSPGDTKMVAGTLRILNRDVGAEWSKSDTESRLRAVDEIEAATDIEVVRALGNKFPGLEGRASARIEVLQATRTKAEAMAASASREFDRLERSGRIVEPPKASAVQMPLEPLPGMIILNAGSPPASTAAAPVKKFDPPLAEVSFQLLLEDAQRPGRLIPTPRYPENTSLARCMDAGKRLAAELRLTLSQWRCEDLFDDQKMKTRP